MIRICLACLLLLALPTHLMFAQEQEKPADSLEGTWRVQNAELSGQKFPAEVSKTMSITMKQGQYIARVGMQLDKGTYSVDTDAQPAKIDIVGTEGPNKGKTLLGIFGVSGNSLTVCYDLSGKERPTEFEAPQGTMQFLVTYKRE